LEALVAIEQALAQHPVFGDQGDSVLWPPTDLAIANHLP
jgi:hypothetical protein